MCIRDRDETADSYIERAAAEMNTVQNLVEVATSDLNEQWAIFSQGALRVSARELVERVNTVKSCLLYTYSELIQFINYFTQTLNNLLGEENQKADPKDKIYLVPAFIHKREEDVYKRQLRSLPT